jgi:hypothetical protein
MVSFSQEKQDGDQVDNVEGQKDLKERIACKDSPWVSH